uniref:Uncharacterized protein n=1 Tax=Sphaerodactylus townsendi TaxID=933632 RepID=A0ACB8G775_9SAUR
MGDMKTPDFDDLLAAFDIPDIDTNEAIHSGSEEAEAHIKPVPVEAVVPDHVLPHGDITTVSVIVKNTVCPEQLDPPDSRVKDSHAIGPRLLQNGFAPSEVPHSPLAGPAEVAASTNGECWTPKEKAAKGLDLFSHFSPDPNEDGAANLIDQPRECKPKEKPLSVPSLSPSPTLPSAQPPDCREPAAEIAGSLPSTFPQPFESGSSGGAGLPPSPPPLTPLAIKQEADGEVPCRGGSPLGPPKSSSVCYSVDDSARGPWPRSETNVNSGSGPRVKRSPASPPGPFFKSSPQADRSLGPSASPKQPEGGALKEEPVEKPVQCPPDASSGEEEENDDESTGSPSSNSSRPLKVRIKTIKTSSGSITRTVTRVPSDSDPGAAKPPSDHDSQGGPVAEEAAPPAPAEKGEGPTESPNPKMVVTSPLKVIEGPKVISVQLGDGTKIKGTVLPVSTIQNASSAMLMAASVAQQKAVVLPSKAVAKNIISLVPQAFPKASDARGNVGTVPQPAAATAAANQKVNGTTVVVMQPQNSSPPVAGTVISRSQSSLVEAFNKILNSKNLLPTYKPNLAPPTDSSLTLPPLGYRCLECGDAFALEKSLARHYDRRSMRIEVTCNHCTKRLVFFNKCSLLLHAREHKDKGLVMQCSHLVMRPIALDQMIGQPDITPLVSVASLNAGKVAAAAGVTQEAVAAAANGGASQDLPVLPLNGGSEPATTNSCQCLECKEQCKDKAGLAAHFQQATPSSSTVCSTCPMIMPNRCSFSAHQRMHKNRPPHVCPECGGNFLLANFEAHLKEACLHFSRRIGYSAHAHIYTQHPGFSNQQSAAGRGSAHGAANTHQPQKPKEEPAKKPAAAPLTPKPEPAEEEPPTPAAKILDTSSSSSEDEDPANPPELQKSKRGQLPAVKSECVKKFPCRLCERSFCSAPSLRRHVRVNHEGIKRVYPCRYCTEGKRTFSSRLILEKHIQVRHGIKVTDETRSQEVLITRLGSRNSQASGRKRKLSSDEGDSCSEEPDSTTPPSKTPRGDRKAQYHCRKCGYMASTAADFQEHIPQHRTGESAHQCHECGLCFTSQVSLNRHRFITHKKKRGAGDAEEPGAQGDPKEGSPPDAEGKLLCTVCGKGFDTQLNLKTHFRTHGMAFIKARQNVGAEN